MRRAEHDVAVSRWSLITTAARDAKDPGRSTGQGKEERDEYEINDAGDSLAVALSFLGGTAAALAQADQSTRSRSCCRCEPDSLDPCDTQTAQNANVVRGNVFESLTHVSPVDGTSSRCWPKSWKHDQRTRVGVQAEGGREVP